MDQRKVQPISDTENVLYDKRKSTTLALKWFHGHHAIPSGTPERPRGLLTLFRNLSCRQRPRRARGVAPSSISAALGLARNQSVENSRKVIEAPSDMPAAPIGDVAGSGPRPRRHVKLFAECQGHLPAPVGTPVTTRAARRLSGSSLEVAPERQKRGPQYTQLDQDTLAPEELLRKSNMNTNKLLPLQLNASYENTQRHPRCPRRKLKTSPPQT